MTRPNRLGLVVASLLGVAALGAGGGAAVYAASSSAGTTTVVRQVTVGDSEPAGATSSLSVAEIYRRTYRGVVEVTASGAASTPFQQSQPQRAQGSGFVYDDEGHIVTNQHVVDGAQTVSVRFWTGATYDAEVVGTDPSTDLAVLTVDAPSSLLHPLTLADSSGVAVGDPVVAIGSPYGLEETVTSGIVSALHRQMTAPNGFAINDAVQTDAAINHGNSGGPLLDSSARVIGVNAQIESDSGGNDGVGFAIPADTVRSVADELVSSGTVEHAYLGVAVQSIPSSVASQLAVPAGAAVTEVRNGTPAADAGLRAATGTRTLGGEEYPTGGDVITEIDGSRITSAEDLQAAIDAKRPGDTISVTYVRDGKTRTVDIELANRPS
jgi:S1-C subfamily serine protease